MATTNYHTVNGEIIGQTASGVRTGYLTDGLGSVTATQGSTGSVLATYRYKPYGALLAKTGAGSDPKFLWNGSNGYRGSYVRRRTYDQQIGTWLSIDPIWPDEPPFSYTFCDPVSLSDPTGLSPCLKPCTPALAVKKVSSKCDIKPGSKPNTYQVRVYKCMKVHCKVVGGPGDDCTLKQYVRQKKWSGGKLIIQIPASGAYDEIDGPAVFSVSCPGSEWFYDAPGVHSTRATPKTECSTINFSTVDFLNVGLPVTMYAHFRNVCRCGDKAVTEKWSFGYKLSKDSRQKHGLKCEFLIVPEVF